MLLLRLRWLRLLLLLRRRRQWPLLMLRRGLLLLLLLQLLLLLRLLLLPLLRLLLLLLWFLLLMLLLLLRPACNARGLLSGSWKNCSCHSSQRAQHRTAATKMPSANYLHYRTFHIWQEWDWTDMHSRAGEACRLLRCNSRPNVLAAEVRIP